VEESRSESRQDFRHTRIEANALETLGEFRYQNVAEEK